MNDNDASPVGSGNEILLYQTEDGETKIEVKLEGETVWLTQAQIADLFQRNLSVISKHIKNIFATGEIDEANSVINLQTQKIEGKRDVIREMRYYNLDVIISVGYRVNSRRGTQFRMWATRTLRHHLISHIQRLQELCVEMLESTTQDDALFTETSGYIYVIKAPNGTCKIGRTKNPEMRFKSFTTILPFELDCILLMETEDMFFVEAEIHKYFAAKRTNGEWFALDEQDLTVLRAWQC